MRTVKATDRRMSQKEIADIAKSHLISQRKCSTSRNSRYTMICYGLDLNMLDESRRWLYDENFAISHDAQRAKDSANKTVLYVNQHELEAEIKKLRAEEGLRLQRLAEKEAK